jgi:hypothetical protein
MGMWVYRSIFYLPRPHLDVSGQLHAPAALPLGKQPRYPLDRRQSAECAEEKILDPIGIRILTPRPSSYKQQMREKHGKNKKRVKSMTNFPYEHKENGFRPRAQPTESFIDIYSCKIYYSVSYFEDYFASNFMPLLLSASVIFNATQCSAMFTVRFSLIALK